MSLVKVTNTPFVRDTQSMAIINVDNSAKQEYYEKVRLAAKQKEQINKMNGDISELRDELGEIKQLLQQLVGKQ
jgi:TolA-binding protein